MDQPTSLYRYFDSSGTLLYVGITSRRTGRSLQHASEKSWWSEVADCTWEHFETRSEAAVRELEAIRTERPLHNVIGRTGGKAATKRTIDHVLEAHRRFPEDVDMAWLEGQGRYATVSWCAQLTVRLWPSLAEAEQGLRVDSCGHGCWPDHEIVNLAMPEAYEETVEHGRLERRRDHFRTCATCEYLSEGRGVHAAIERSSIRIFRAEKQGRRRTAMVTAW